LAETSSGGGASLFTKVIGGAIGVVFVLFWSGITFTADFFVGRDIARQCATYGFAATEGTITKSEVTTRHGAKGSTNHRWDLNYTYLVCDQRLQGTRYRFQSSDDRGDAPKLSERFPVGSRPTVYYDAADPSRAVLLRGLEGRDLFIPLFLMPFNLIALVGWSVIFAVCFRRNVHFDTGGVRVRDDGLELRAFVPDHSALFVFGAAIFGTCFVMIFVVGFITGFEPSLALMIGVWGLVFAVAIWFALPRFLRERRGQSDLVIDRFGKRLTLPITHGRKEQVEVPFATLVSTKVKEVRTKGSKGRTNFSYHVMLSAQNVGKDQCVWQSTDAEKAERFATWLKGAVGEE
jgi:hypothetical protein